MHTVRNIPPAVPKIWLVMGEKLGDNAQIERIADYLGLPYEIRRLRPKQQYLRGKPRFKISLNHLDLDHSDALQPPWPNLVITVGRRHSMAALWIKAQSPGTKIVLLGRPRRWIEQFDLVITLPQYQLPQLDNVVRLSLPLVRVDREAVNRARQRWSDEFKSFKRPVTAIFVGGPTQPYRFDRSVARTLVSACVALRSKSGGTLYFVTSPRTTTEVTAEIAEHLPDGSRLYQWEKGDSENPYLALLGLADRCVVTGDSVSMMIEAADLAKPLAIFPLPTLLLGKLWQAVSRRLCGEHSGGILSGIYTRLGNILYSSGLMGFPRDLTEIHRRLIDDGLAAYLDDGFSAPKTRLPSELDAVRQRIFDLLGVETRRPEDMVDLSDTAQ